MRLSLAMIVKNEERFLARALASAQPLCEELIVVDTGSTDRTVELAEQMGAKVSHFEWIEDFSAARNASLDRCTGEWILVLDGDDVIPPETLRKILELKNGTPSEIAALNQFDVVEVTYEYLYDEHDQCAYAHPQVRLVRRASALRYQNRVHENIDCPPWKVLHREDIVIEHRFDPNTERERLTTRIGPMLERAIAEEHPPKTDTLRYYAFYLVTQGRLEEGREYLLRYREAEPDSKYAYSVLDQLSHCNSMLGDEDAALDFAMQARAMDDTRAEAHVRIGLYYFRKNDWINAIPHLTAATRCVRHNRKESLDECYTYLPWDLLSLCYANSGDFVRAVECAERALTFGVDVERIAGNRKLFAGRM